MSPARGGRSRKSVIGGGHRQARVRLKTAKQRSASSQRWLERQLNDPYVGAAQREGYRSRAAFKLLELDAKFGILRPGYRVVDLGAAPGGWSQVAAARVKAAEGKGQVVALDILDMEQIPGVTFVQLDFLSEGATERLKGMLREGTADLVLSDMAGQGTGHVRTDHLRIVALAEAAAEFAMEVLAPGGAFVCKVFQGGTERELLEKLKRAFTSVKHAKPPASRAESAELYLVATGFRRAPGP